MSDLPQTQEVRAVCQHEAAHAIVALALGHKVLGISVKMDEELGPHGATACQDSSDRDHWDPEVMYDDFLITMAGVVLDSDAGRIQPGSVSDMHHANSLLVPITLYFGGTIDQHVARAQRIIREILDKNEERVYAMCDLIMYIPDEFDLETFEVWPYHVDYPQKGDFI